MNLLALISLIILPFSTVRATQPNTSTAAITTTKVTPSYWRVTFSSPPFNLQNTAWYTSLYTAIDDIANDPDVKVVVFDSSAPDFYIAHYDMINGVSQDLMDGYWANITRLANLPVLTVAAIRGIVRGGGVEFTSALDVRFGSKEKAVLGQIEASIGVIAGGGGLALFPSLVGRSRALEIAVGADDFDADTAALYGWINRAIPDHKFEHFVDRFARRVAAFDHYAINTTKSILNKRYGFPTVAEQQEEFNAFVQAASQGVVQARIAALIDVGLQSDVDFEIHPGAKILEVTGPGPWSV